MCKSLTKPSTLALATNENVSATDAYNTEGSYHCCDPEKIEGTVE